MSLRAHSEGSRPARLPLTPPRVITDCTNQDEDESEARGAECGQSYFLETACSRICRLCRRSRRAVSREVRHVAGFAVEHD